MQEKTIYLYFDESCNSYWASMIHPCNKPVFSKAATKDESIKQLKLYGVDVDSYTVKILMLRQKFRYEILMN